MFIGMHQPLFDATVNFIGQEVAAVAALDEVTAAEAAALIRVEYEPLPEIPLPNDVATWPDPTSRTGLRLKASLAAPTAIERSFTGKTSSTMA